MNKLYLAYYTTAPPLHISTTQEFSAPFWQEENSTFCNYMLLSRK